MISSAKQGWADFIGARDYALTQLQHELPYGLFYHSLWHTRDEVAMRAAWLAKQENISPEGLFLVQTAAYFHDIGFIQKRKDHELTSAKIASEVLPHFGYTTAQIHVVMGIIIATRLPQTPHNLLEKIVADADLDVLGRDDFISRNQALRTELAMAGTVFSDETWYANQIRFVENHTYFTKTARATRQGAKAQNLQALRQRLVDSRSPKTQPAIYPVGSPSFMGMEPRYRHVWAPIRT
jgi:uncharacterized protein